MKIIKPPLGARPVVRHPRTKIKQTARVRENEINKDFVILPFERFEFETLMWLTINKGLHHCCVLQLPPLTISTLPSNPICPLRGLNHSSKFQS